MPRDNSVNKMAYIHAVATILGVRNMPLNTIRRSLIFTLFSFVNSPISKHLRNGEYIFSVCINTL